MDAALEAVVTHREINGADFRLLPRPEDDGRWTLRRDSETGSERRHCAAAKVRDFRERVVSASAVLELDLVTLFNRGIPRIHPPRWVADQRRPRRRRHGRQ